LKKIRLLTLLISSFTLGPLSTTQAGDAVRLYEFGADEMAYLALPKEAPKGSILLIPDSFGVPEVVASRCDLLARLGFVAMTIDLYNTQTAENPETARRLQSKVNTVVAQKMIKAAMNLLSVSPQYRTNNIIVGVWGENMEFVKAALADSSMKVSLTSLTWFDPSGALQGDPFKGLPKPLHVLTSNGPWNTAYIKSQENRPLKKIAANLSYYNAPQGFLIQEETNAMAIQAWTYIIETWNEILPETKKAGSTAATPETAKLAEPATLKPPTKPAAHQSEIMPKRNSR